MAPITACALPWGAATLQGPLVNGVCQFAVQYATAERFEDSVQVPDWANLTSTALPVPACPQLGELTSGLHGYTQSEQCLYMTLYVPYPSCDPCEALPTLAWLHGGTYYYGSTSAPGLDGSTLAREGRMIVAEVQYRQGVLGHLPPRVAPSTDDPNLALRDAILALQVLKSRVGQLGGDENKITLAGQSTGASMVRALLSAPSAKGLFRGMILQSDPMMYGMAPPSVMRDAQAVMWESTLNNPINPSPYGSPASWNFTALEEYKNMPIEQILLAQRNFVASRNTVVGADGSDMFRPTFNTTTLPLDPLTTLFADPSKLSTPPASVPVLLTSVRDEAARLVGDGVPTPLPVSLDSYYLLLWGYVGEERARQILSSAIPEYSLGNGPDTVRETLMRVGTDMAWRCAIRAAAGAYSAAGGTAFVGEFGAGVTYPDNVSPFCAGRVCHSDDIYLTFSTSPDPSPQVEALQADVLAQWAGFVWNQRPVDSNWQAVGPGPNPSGMNVRAIGGGSTVACPAGFWGEKVLWDWQYYTEDRLASMRNHTYTYPTTTTAAVALTKSTKPTKTIKPGKSCAALSTGSSPTVGPTATGKKRQSPKSGRCKAGRL